MVLLGKLDKGSHPASPTISRSAERWLSNFAGIWRLVDLLRSNAANQRRTALQCGKHRDSQQAVYLPAAWLAMDAPFTEVLTVVAGDSITILPQARAGARYDVGTLVAAVTDCLDEYGASGRETLQGYLLDRATMPKLAKACIVNHSTFPNMDPMVPIAAAQGHEVGA
jgi:hypothetical protein